MTSAWKLVVHLENYLHLTDIHCCSLGVLNYSSLPNTTHIHQHMHALTHTHTCTHGEAGQMEEMGK